MSCLLDVGGSGVAFLVDQGTEFLGNGLRSCYFHNSHSPGTGGSGDRKNCETSYYKKKKKKKDTKPKKNPRKLLSLMLHA